MVDYLKILKMKNVQYLTLCFLLFFLASGCKEDLGITKPLVNDGTAPGSVNSAQVENRAGSAKLTYKIPSDNDLLYVKAIYEIRPGVKREVRSSKTNDSLIVDGFGEAKEYEVQLYAVDNGENVSKPITVKVNPLEPPVKTILKNLKVIDDFGGVGVLYTNPTGAEVALVVVKKDASDKDQNVNTFYTKAVEGSFNVRGYPVSPIVFGVYVRDKYGNVSETVYKTITPIEEVRLDRLLFKRLQLPNDVKELSTAWDSAKMWDNAFGDTQGFHSNTDITILMPIWVSLDMGVKAKLSRFKEFQRTTNNSYIFNHNNLKRFEVWGSNDPASDGSWDSWELLGTYESLKPSKLPVGQLSNDDIAYAKAGEEFNFSPSAPAVRYIRIKALENWSGGGIMQIMELQFWGKVQQ